MTPPSPPRPCTDSSLSLIGWHAQVRIGTPDKDAILRQVKSKNYQLACQRHFEATHKGHAASSVSTDGVGNHPNAWMHASMEFYKEKVG